MSLRFSSSSSSSRQKDDDRHLFIEYSINPACVCVVNIPLGYVDDGNQSAVMASPSPPNGSHLEKRKNFRRAYQTSRRNTGGRLCNHLVSFSISYITIGYYSFWGRVRRGRLIRKLAANTFPARKKRLPFAQKKIEEDVGEPIS